MTRPYHHGDLRRRLVAEARRSLIRNPDPSALSIRELARRIGVSQNAPYRHFADRDALLEAIGVVGYEEAAAQLAERSAEGSSAVASVWEGLADREPGLVRLMLRTGAGGGVGSASRVWLAEIAAAIEPEVGTSDPERLIRRSIACWAAVLGMSVLARGGLLGGLDGWMVPRSADLARGVVFGR